MTDQFDARLLEASATGDIATIRAAIAAGADLNVRDTTGRTPLLVAAQSRQTTSFRLLLEGEADVDLQDDQLDNPFLFAAAEGLLDILQLANEAGADPALANKDGSTTIIRAVERGHLEVVRYLLDQSDVDVDHVNQTGGTALLNAILQSDGGPLYQAIVGLLIENGADVDLADKDGITPLAHARTRGQTEIATLLQAAGASA